MSGNPLFRFGRNGEQRLKVIQTEPIVERRKSDCFFVVSRLGLEPRALALKGLIRLLRSTMTENDEERQSPGQD